MTDAFGITLVLLALCVVLIFLRWCQQRYNPHPELLRKTLHVLMGSITLTFPWLFHSIQPVMLLSVISAALLVVLKRNKAAHQALGQVFCSVNRPSHGELFFPLAVCVLFYLSHGNPVLYVVPMLILTVSDAASALVGIFSGHHFYSTREGRKTTEGSLAFLITAALCCFAVLMASGVAVLTAALVAVNLACVAMLFEAIAWRGLDNLFVPLSSHFMLMYLLTVSTTMLVANLIVAVLLVSIAIIWRKRTTLDDSAALGSALVCFFSWLLGGWVWLLAPLTALLTYGFLLPRMYRHRERPHSIIHVLGVSALGLFWLALWELSGDEHLLLPYTLGYATHCGMIAIAHIRTVGFGPSYLKKLMAVALASWCIFFTPVLFRPEWQTILAPSAFISLGLTVLGILAFYVLRGPERYDLASIHRWWRQIVVATSCTIAGNFAALSVLF